MIKRERIEVHIKKEGGGDSMGRKNRRRKFRQRDIKQDNEKRKKGGMVPLHKAKMKKTQLNY